MKRLTSSSDSLGALMSICPNSTVEVDEQGYSRDFQTMLEGLDADEGCCVEEGETCQKKRRLTVDQVKALEKNFEVENKLEPERKVKLAQELGLQPRQVAVWFQNRRARWKTKQLERDYSLLKANHDALRLKFEALQRDNEAMLNQIEELKEKVSEHQETTDSKVKEEPLVCNETEEKSGNNCGEDDDGNSQMLLGSFFEDLKDGSSDSDSSAILNEETSNKNSMNGVLVHSPDENGQHHQFLDIHSGCSSSVCFQFGNNTTHHHHHHPQQHPVKAEEHNFFGEESCTTLFSDDQPPTLNWCCSDGWN